jgi:predicted DNA-binding transcriptional regulator AlpA
MQQLDQLLDTAGAAKLLGIAPRTLLLWRMEGTGPQFVRVGTKAVRYRSADIARFVEAGIATSTKRAV